MQSYILTENENNMPEFRIQKQKIYLYFQTADWRMPDKIVDSNATSSGANEQIWSFDRIASQRRRMLFQKV
jgi:hypothetical protein